MGTTEIPSYQKNDCAELLENHQPMPPRPATTSTSGSTQQQYSNNQVLGIAFYSFLGFTIVQISFAVQANSSAMMADSAAMFVDAGTYLCNMLAEKIKSRPITQREAILYPPLLLQHRRKLERLYLELFPPAISVLTLLYVTCATFGTAMTTLLLATGDIANSANASEGAENNAPIDVIQGKEDGGTGHESKPPNLKIMMFFSILNLLLDAVNFTCFARAEQTIVTLDLDGASTSTSTAPVPVDENKVDVETEALQSESSPLILELIHENVENRTDDDDDEENHYNYIPPSAKNKDHDDYIDNDASTTMQTSLGDTTDDELSEDSLNLNMCSAFTVSFIKRWEVAYFCTSQFAMTFCSMTDNLDR